LVIEWILDEFMTKGGACENRSAKERSQCICATRVPNNSATRISAKLVAQKVVRSVFALREFLKGSV